MKIDNLSLQGIKQIANMQEKISDLTTLLDQKLNLKEYPNDLHALHMNQSMVLRTCLLAGLSDKSERSVDDVLKEELPYSNSPYATTFFSKSQIGKLFEALIKLRYGNIDADWSNSTWVSKVIGREILRGHNLLMREGALDDWLNFIPRKGGKALADIPELQLHIGEYSNGMDAYLDMNSRAIANTQILVAGTTGSGKSNLLSVLIQQLRSASADTHYPVNFLLFDYKGEFSDPANAGWLSLFETDSSCVLNPIDKPLPFTPFRDFSGHKINEVNMYATSLSTALSSIARTTISAKMEERLSSAIIEAYQKKDFRPVTFEDILYCYTEGDEEKSDSVTSVLREVSRNNIFSEEDKIDLVENSYIINLGKYPKDGMLAKAIVYFTISKLNAIYDSLPKQAMNDERVELRHFTIIDEAHYMLSFENKPLQNLIAVGRNKGMSIILATQNMESFKSKYFDFYANAQYPLIMKQQQQNDAVLKDLFSVTGNALQDLKQAIGSLQKGELIIKDNNASLLGLNNRNWQKIKVTHLI